MVHKVIEGDQAVRFPATESGLGLDDRIAAAAGKPLQGADQQCAKAGGDVGVIEEIDGVAVFGGAGASVMNLLKICREFGLPECALGDIGTGFDDLAPGGEVAGSSRRPSLAAVGLAGCSLGASPGASAASNRSLIRSTSRFSLGLLINPRTSAMWKR
ncbi:MAG: hypothetical protein OXG33_04825 [Chloroflexi bacterium]|nr:hypothetical protein [Chloroflexota bacterium]